MTRARVFALLDVSMNDSILTSHSSKFIYGLWRPVTAIRRAAEDMNDLTEADPTWSSLHRYAAVSVLWRQHGLCGGRGGDSAGARVRHR